MGWRDTYYESGKLGEGSFGVVYKAHWYYITDYAVKEIKKVDSSAIQEIEILKQLRHPNIIRYVEHYYDKRRNEMAIVMEFANQGTMTSYRSSLARESRIATSEKSLWYLLYEISSALSYLHRHKQRIMHRDLKPDNILCISSNKALPTFKLADFGIAKLLNRDAQGRYYTDTVAGTYIYMAPEVLNGEEYTFSADMWSLGAIASFWYNKMHLFHERDEVLTWKGGKSTLSKNFDLKIRNLVAWLLHPNHRQRPTAESILKTINEGGYLNSWCTIL